MAWNRGFAVASLVTVTTCQGSPWMPPGYPGMHSANASFQSCEHYTRDSDVRNMGLSGAVVDLCAHEIGCQPLNEWKMNWDQYPEYPSCLVPMSQSVTWGSARITDSQQVRMYDEMTNNGPDGATLTIDAGHTVTATSTVSVSHTTSLSATLSLTLKTPFEEVGMSETLSVESTEGKSSSKSKAVQIGHKVISGPVSHGETVCATTVATYGKHTSQFRHPVCLTGYVLCHYQPKCNTGFGTHYYWFPPLSNYPPNGGWCNDITGEATADVYSETSTTISYGPCPSQDTLV